MSSQLDKPIQEGKGSRAAVEYRLFGEPNREQPLSSLLSEQMRVATEDRELLTAQ